MCLWQTKNLLIPCFQKLMLRGEPSVAESVLSHQPGTGPCRTTCEPAEGRMAPPGAAKESHYQDHSRPVPLTAGREAFQQITNITNPFFWEYISIYFSTN